MKLALSSIVSDNRLARLVSLINNTIKVQLPAVTSDRQDLVYVANISQNEIIKLSIYKLGDKHTLHPQNLWLNDSLVIAKCLPKFTRDSSKAYRDLMAIINTNSDSFITLIDPIVEKGIQEKITVDSEVPLFTMSFPCEPFEEVTKNHTLNDADVFLEPTYRTGTDSFHLNAIKF